MDPEDSVRLIYEAYNNRDLDAAISQLHPNVRWDNGEGRMLNGREAVAEHWQQQWEKADAKVRIDAIHWQDANLDLSVAIETSDSAGATTSQRVNNTVGFADGLIASMQIVEL
jgi:nuclear transport factor 2 (NTF2) superfamily protein